MNVALSLLSFREAAWVKPVYYCGDCGARGCKLWQPRAVARPSHWKLRCVLCSVKHVGPGYSYDPASGGDIGHLSPAIPVHASRSMMFWTFYAPDPGDAHWWAAQPLHPSRGPSA